jgi:DNA-binding NarL/FixJ family response regulator
VSPAISETSQNSYAFQGSALRATRTSSPDRFATLTARERLELRLVVEGASSRDIASRLKVGLRTVAARRISLMRKLGLKGRGALIRYALHRGVTLGNGLPASTTKKLRGLAAAEIG